MLKHVAPWNNGCTNEEQLTVVTRSMKYIDFIAQPHICAICKFTFIFFLLFIKE